MAKAKTDPIIVERDRLIDFLEGADPCENDYTRVLESAIKLTEMAESNKKKPTIKADTWLLVGVSVAGLAATLMFEHSGHTITSKTWGAVSKLLSPKI